MIWAEARRETAAQMWKVLHLEEAADEVTATSGRERASGLVLFLGCVTDPGRT